MNAERNQPRTSEFKWLILLLGATVCLALLGGLASSLSSLPTPATPALARPPSDSAFQNERPTPLPPRSPAPMLVRVNTEPAGSGASKVASSTTGSAGLAAADAGEVIPGNNASDGGDGRAGVVASIAQSLPEGSPRQTAGSLNGGRAVAGFRPGLSGDGSGESRAPGIGNGGSPGGQVGNPDSPSSGEGSALAQGPGRADTMAPGEKVSGIKVTYKQDPRMTRSLHMGDRWVSPTVYGRVGEGAVVTFEAKANGLGAAGQEFGIPSEWRAGDPEMIVLAPGEDGAVRVTINRPGQSRLSIAAAGHAQELLVNAAYRSGILVAEITRIP